MAQKKPAKVVQKKPAKVVKVSGSKQKLFMLPYKRINYILMIAGFAMIVIGFMLMAGGKQQGEVFNFDEIYSFRRVTLAPIVVMLGFAVEVFAVMWVPKEKSGNDTPS